MEQDHALALLREHHSFPGPFTFRFVVRSETTGVVQERLSAVGELIAVELNPSRAGRFVSVRATVVMSDAEGVLSTYAEISSIEGVLTAM